MVVVQCTLYIVPWTLEVKNERGRAANWTSAQMEQWANKGFAFRTVAASVARSQGATRAQFQWPRAQFQSVVGLAAAVSTVAAIVSRRQGATRAQGAKQVAVWRMVRNPEL